jgi:hypothetical protein
MIGCYSNLTQIANVKPNMAERVCRLRQARPSSTAMLHRRPHTLPDRMS